MFIRLREQFSATALILSVIALVFALMGGAYAASQPQAKKTKVVKGPRGPRGKEGPQGPAGANGALGPKGDPGAKGDKGDLGSKGDSGANGASAVVSELIEPECEGRNGAEVKVKGENSGVLVCEGEEGAEGKEGKQGKEGSPWTAGGMLPKGSTETGSWAFGASEDNGTKIFAPIPFVIPLASVLGEEHVHFQDLPTKEAFKAACPGGVANPQAKEGELCVYFSVFGEGLTNATFKNIYPPYQIEEAGAGKAGATLQFSFSGGAGEQAYGFGTWAVTGS